MPRTRRLIINDETAVYHVMSRTALDGFPLADIEKDFILDLMVQWGRSCRTCIDHEREDCRARRSSL